MVSVYSIVSSIIFYNLSLVILFILRRKTDFMARYAISTLLLLSALSMVRLFVPIDFDAARVIRSAVVLPKIIEILEAKPGFWPLSIGNTLLVIWALGSITHTAKTCFADHKAYKARKRYPRIASEQLKRVSAKLDKAYSIIISPKVSQPYTVGIFKPVIYLPYIEYSDAELYYILLHEVQHIKSRDNLKRLFFLIVEIVFWWNPLAYIGAEDFELLTEYSCDSKVTANMDDAGVTAYLRTIISVLTRLNPDEDKVKPKLAAKFAQTYDIKQRFEVLLKRNDHKPRRTRYTVWIIMLLVFVMSYFVIFQPYYSMPSASQGEDVHITEDSYYILIADDHYLLICNDVIIAELSEEDLTSPPFDELILVGG